MKRGRIGISLLLILLVLGLVAAFYMTGMEDISQTVRSAAALAGNEDWEGAQRLLRKANKDWHSRRHFTACLTDHGTLEEIDSMLSQLEVYQRHREALPFVTLCTQLEHRLQDLSEAQKLTWWNVL